MRKPKILIGLTYYLPNISGVSQYASIVAEEMVKRKYEVVVLTAKFRKELKGDEVINRLAIRRIAGVNVGKGFIMPWYWFVSMREVAKNDVINCHLPAVESFWLAIWAKIWGKKLVVTHHCEFNFSGIWSNKVIALITYPIHFWVYLLADKIISYTQDYAKASIFLRFFKKKICFILPPVKINQPLHPSLNRAGGKKNVGFAGRIGWEKGIDVLIKAMKTIDAQLWLAGPYKDVVGDKTYEELKPIISKKVKFLGPIKHEQMGDFYRSIDCLVLPSTNNLETFGIVQAEAMVCGTPVVASNLPGVRVPVKLTGMGDIARVGNADDMAKKIKMVLEKKYDKKMIEKAKNIFDLNKFFERYEKCLN